MVVESIRRITIRVPSQLHRALAQVAAQSDVSLSQLAVEAFKEYLSSQAAQGRFPLKELSHLLAPAARAKKLNEKETVRHIKEARRHIWKERYQQAIEKTPIPRAQARGRG